MELSDLTLALVAACSRAQQVLSVAGTTWYVTYGTCEMQAAHINFKQRVTTHWLSWKSACATRTPFQAWYSATKSNKRAGTSPMLKGNTSER